MSFRWEGTVTRKGKTHLKFTSTPRCVGSFLQYFKNTNECPPKHKNHFQSTTIILQNTTITSRAQRRIAIHNSKHNKVSRNTTITTTNKAMNLPPWTPVISKWWRTAYSVDITSNNWHNKTSKFRFLCIVLAITCATLLAQSQSQALKSSTQSDWPLIRLSFTGKKLWFRVGGEMKHENLISKEFTRVKFLPQEHKEADDSSSKSQLRSLFTMVILRLSL